MKVEHEDGPKANNCFKCKYSEKVTGSAHLSCNACPATIGIAFLQYIATSRVPDLTIGGELKLKLDEHGVRSGWAYWPVNFDPVWVECYLTDADVKYLTERPVDLS